ncbi:hypothetical protein DVH05_012173 [Phytophthora capsici]|nr:hypothetical protein DVH05_012173 [Phytophthora capsici]
MDDDTVVAGGGGFVVDLDAERCDDFAYLSAMEVDMVAGSFNVDTEDDETLAIYLLFITLGALFGTMDWRSLRAPPSEKIAVRSDFYAKLKAHSVPQNTAPNSSIFWCIVPVVGTSLLQQVWSPRKEYPMCF